MRPGRIQRLIFGLFFVAVLVSWDYPHNQIYYHYKCNNDGGDRVYEAVNLNSVLMFDWSAVDCNLLCLKVLSSRVVDFVEVISVDNLSDQRNVDDLSDLIEERSAHVNNYSRVGSRSDFCKGKKIYNSSNYFKHGELGSFDFCLKNEISDEIKSKIAIESVQSFQTFILRVTYFGYRLFSLSDNRTISSSYLIRLWPTGLYGVLSRAFVPHMSAKKRCERQVDEAGHPTDYWLTGPFARSSGESIHIQLAGGED